MYRFPPLLYKTNNRDGPLFQDEHFERLQCIIIRSPPFYDHQYIEYLSQKQSLGINYFSMHFEAGMLSYDRILLIQC